MRYVPALLLTATLCVHGPAGAQTGTAAGLLQRARQEEAAGQLERAAATYNKAAVAFHTAGNTAQETDAYDHSAAASEKYANQLLQNLNRPAATTRAPAPAIPPAGAPLTRPAGVAARRLAPAAGPLVSEVAPLPGKTTGGRPVGLFFFMDVFNNQKVYYFTPAGQVYVNPVDFSPTGLAAVADAQRGTFALNGA